MSCCCGFKPFPPTLNLVCNVWHNPFGVPPAGAPALAGLPCQLVHPLLNFGAFGFAFPVTYCRFAARSDIRGPNGFIASDTIECPAGTGRFYTVSWVEDSGRGFGNEHRVCTMTQLAPWPIPTP